MGESSCITGLEITNKHTSLTDPIGVTFNQEIKTFTEE
jgi:hypothetical protein